MATVVFFTPHQDDETLAMGPAVRHHLEAGHDVHVVLMTTGQNSGVFPSTGLSVADFVAARDDEMFRATRQLGVRTANVLVSPLRTEDGQLTVSAAEDIIAAFFAEHPDAWCKSYSNKAAPGRHVDHVASGQAALNLFNAGLFTNYRMYVEPWLTAAFKTANPSVPITAERAAGTAFVQQAFDQYNVHDGVGGKYGIGHQSVPSEFDAGRADPTSWVHVPVGT
jgi:LmbE family N-acetylglucosaminyl deacetylase